MQLTYYIIIFNTSTMITTIKLAITTRLFKPILLVIFLMITSLWTNEALACTFYVGKIQAPSNGPTFLPGESFTILNDESAEDYDGYRWQRRSPATGGAWVDIPNSNVGNLPTSATETTEYRRGAYDDCDGTGWNYSNTVTITIVNAVFFSDYSADPNLSTSFAHRRGADETPKFTIRSTTAFNAVQFELNTQSDFSGTATVSTINDGTTYAAGTLHDIWTTTPLPTDNRTYFARCRVSTDGGATYSPWTIELWPYSYFSGTVYEEEGWYYTTGEQFNTGVVQETLYDFTRITTTAFPDNGNVTLDQGAFSINAGTGDAVKENGTFYPNVNYMTIGWQNDCHGNNRIYNGFPFNVNIPQNSLILSADFSVVGTNACSCETQSKPLHLIADAHNFGNAPALNTTNIQSAANRTTAKQIINYTTPTWSNNIRYTLAPVNTILQEIVNRGDWSVGNTFNLLLDWNSAYSPESNNNRCMRQANNGATTAPRIEGDFTNFRNTVHFPTVDRAIYGDVGMAWDELKITDNTLCNSCDVQYRIHDAVTNAVLAGPFTRTAGLNGSQSFDISSVGAQFIYVSASVYRTNTTPTVQDIWLTVTEPSPLPVELTSLSAECDNDKVEIAWTTASELYSSHYIVQRSDDLTSWTDVAIVNGKGTSNVTSNYMVTDYSPLRDVNYYRLIQYDMNGEFEEYGPISSKCNYSDFSISLYPNPNDGNFTIRSESDQRMSDITISITDAAGKVIHVDRTTFGKGTTYYNFKNTNLPKGSYFIHFNHSQKAIKPMKLIVR